MSDESVPYVLRRAESEDETFLFQLFVSAQTFAPCGWDAAQRRQLLALQFRARSASYAASYPRAQSDLICTPERTPVGRLLVAAASDGLHLIDIALLPAYRQKGIGTHVLLDLQRTCMTMERRITLNVQREGRAHALYRRLGFRSTSEDAVYARLEWRSSYGIGAPYFTPARRREMSTDSRPRR
jgi:ribosomal protein S18 acetylase RimI-like enzyme